jgi:hypothetical protein
MNTNVQGQSQSQDNSPFFPIDQQLQLNNKQLNNSKNSSRFSNNSNKPRKLVLDGGEGERQILSST